MITFPTIPGFKHAAGNRYLFLDFDGVLHADTKPPYDLRYASRLLPIVTELALTVVISSAWRHSFSLDALKIELGPLGEHAVGMTPALDEADYYAVGDRRQAGEQTGVRQVEIEHWLSAHATPESAWIAIDDLDYLFAHQHPKIFLTRSDTGLDKKTVAAFETWARKSFPIQVSSV